MDDGGVPVLGSGSGRGWHPPRHRLDGSPGPVLVAVVASICPGDLNVPTFARTPKARSLDGVARAPLYRIQNLNVPRAGRAWRPPEYARVPAHQQPLPCTLNFCEARKCVCVGGWVYARVPAHQPCTL